MTRKFLIPALVVAGAVLTACLPAEAYIDYNGDGVIDADERLWRETTLFNEVKDSQEREAARSTDCYGALGHFSGNHDDARRIIHRESRNNPAAQNSRSSAAGCFQLLKMHSWRFDAVGCSWAQRYDAVCNTKAADHLYRQAGWSPWRLTY